MNYVRVMHSDYKGLEAGLWKLAITPLQWVPALGEGVCPKRIIRTVCTYLEIVEVYQQFRRRECCGVGREISNDVCDHAYQQVS